MLLITQMKKYVEYTVPDRSNIYGLQIDEIDGISYDAQNARLQPEFLGQKQDQIIDSILKLNNLTNDEHSHQVPTRTYWNEEVDADKLSPYFSNNRLDATIQHCYNMGLNSLLIVVDDSLAGNPDDVSDQISTILGEEISENTLLKVEYLALSTFLQYSAQNYYIYCMVIVIQQASLTEAAFDMSIIYPQVVMPVFKLYSQYYNTRANRYYEHQEGQNPNGKSWNKFTSNAYYWVHTRLVAAFLKVTLDPANNQNLTQTLQIIFMPMKSEQFVFKDMFETSIFVFMYPFSVCVMFYFPLLFLLREMIKDDKSKRLKKMQQLGLQNDTVIVSWLIIQLIIVCYYTAIINGIGYTISQGASNFFIIFLYGMTTFGSAYIIMSFIKLTKNYNNVMIISIISHFSSYVYTIFSDQCILGNSNFSNFLFHFIFPNLAIKDGLLSFVYKNFQIDLGIFPSCFIIFDEEALKCLLIAVFYLAFVGILMDNYHHQMSSYAINKIERLIFCKLFKRKEYIQLRLKTDQCPWDKDENVINGINSDNNKGIDMLAMVIQSDLNQRKSFKDILINKADAELRSKMEKHKKVLKVSGLPIFNDQKVSFQAYQSQIVVILGDNGSGKSSIIKALSGLFEPKDLAYVSVYDIGNIEKDLYSYEQNIGYSIDKFCYFSYLTVNEQLQLYATLYKIEDYKIKHRIQFLLSMMNLQGRKNLPIYYLSHGEKIRFQITVVLLNQPKCLFLDLSSFELDPSTKTNLKNFLLSHRRNLITIISTNDIDYANVLADRIIILKKGSIQCFANQSLLLKDHPLYCRLIFLNPQFDQKNLMRILKKMKITKIVKIESSRLVSQVVLNVSHDNNLIVKLCQQIEGKLPNLQYVISFEVNQQVVDRVQDFDNFTDNKVISLKHLNTKNDENNETKKITKCCKCLFFVHVRALITSKFQEERQSQWGLLNQIITLSMIISFLIWGVHTSKSLYTSHITYFTQPQNDIENFFLYDFAVNDGSVNASYFKAANFSNSLKNQVFFNTSQFDSYQIENMYYQNRLGTVYNNSDIGQIINIVDQEIFKMKTYHHCTNHTERYFGGFINIHTPDPNAYKIVVFINEVKDQRNFQIFTQKVYEQFLRQITKKKTFTLSSYICPLLDYEHCITSSENQKQRYSSNIIYTEGALLSTPLFGIYFYLVSERILKNVVREKRKRIKQNFLTYGSAFTYWTSQYITDVFMNSFPQTIAPIIIFFCLSHELQLSYKIVGYISAMLVVFLLANPFFIYFLAYAFHKEMLISKFLLSLYVIQAGIGSMLYITVLMGINAFTPIQQIVIYSNPMSTINFGIAILLYYGRIVESNGRSVVSYINPTRLIRNTIITLIYQSIVCIFFIFLIEMNAPSFIAKIFYLFTCKKKNANINEGYLNEDSFSRREQQYTKNKSLKESQKEAKKLILLNANKISVQFYNPLKTVLNNIKLTIKRGDCIGIVGYGVQNVGFTTLVKALAQVQKLSAGSIRTYKNQFSYCLEDVQMEQNLTVKQVFRKHCMIHKIPSSQVSEIKNKILTTMRIYNKQDHIVASLTLVEQKKLKIAIALINDPDFLLLDEPFAGLDSLSKQQMCKLFAKFLKQQQNAILFTSKSFEDVEQNCNKIGIMKRGNLVAYGTLAQLQKTMPQDLYMLEIQIRIMPELIEQLKFEHDFKRKLKVTQSNFDQILRALKIDSYLLNEILTINKDKGWKQQSLSIQEMRNSLLNGDMVLINNFIEWAMVEYQGSQIQYALTQHFGSTVDLIGRENHRFRFQIGHKSPEGDEEDNDNFYRETAQSDIIGFMEQNKTRFNVIEYRVMKAPLSMVVAEIAKKTTSQSEVINLAAQGSDKAQGNTLGVDNAHNDIEQNNDGQREHNEDEESEFLDNDDDQIQIKKFQMKMEQQIKDMNRVIKKKRLGF